MFVSEYFACEPWHNALGGTMKASTRLSLAINHHRRWFLWFFPRYPSLLARPGVRGRHWKPQTKTWTWTWFQCFTVSPPTNALSNIQFKMNDHHGSQSSDVILWTVPTQPLFIELIKLLQNVLDGGQIVSCTIDINWIKTSSCGAYSADPGR